MPTQVYLLFDERMALHRPIPDPKNPEYYPFENPDRIFRVYGRLLDLERRLARANDDFPYTPRFLEFPCQPVDRDTVELVHTRDHYDWLYHTAFLSEGALRHLTDPDDLYVCPSTFIAASLACGGVVECVNAVTRDDPYQDLHHGGTATKNITRAIALVRPPGHHAEESKAMGTLTLSTTLGYVLILLLFDINLNTLSHYCCLILTSTHFFTIFYARILFL